ncbi:MAG: DNA-directed RNA polymerase subunit beta [Lachnospiraceae bacterium]|nr:DNA-directed RNA polymerase subunit beta [Lachnospiraceae bacterium]
MEKNRFKPVRSGKNVRMNYSRKSENLADMPNLIEVQTSSYKWFREVGLKEAFRDFFPITDHTGSLTLTFEGYHIDEDKKKYTINECKARGKTYSAPMYGVFQLIKRDENGQMIKRNEPKEIFMGDIPLMTATGSFVINGAERVVVSQLVRSPGIYFGSSRDKLGKVLYTSQVIPGRGAWLEYETDSNNVFYVRVDRMRKMPVTTLLRSLGYGTNQEIIDLLGEEQKLYDTFEKDTSDSYETGLLELHRKVKPGDPASKESAENYIRNTFFDSRRYDLAKVGRYKFNKKLNLRTRIAGQILAEDVVDLSTGEILFEAGTKLTRDTAEQIQDAAVPFVYIQALDGRKVKVISNMMVNPLLYMEREEAEELDLFDGNNDPIKVYYPSLYSELESYRTEKAAILAEGNVPEDEKKAKLVSLAEGMRQVLVISHITKEDIIASINYCLNLEAGIGATDDIDHLGNRRIRCVGELLQNQYRGGLTRMVKNIHERMNTGNPDELTEAQLVNQKPVTAAVKEFFGSSQLSQFMDQNNPLAELTHKRRLSALGPGGLSRDRAGFEVRDVHYSHYGRMCPIETPEGPNIGLINSLASYARINCYGFIEAPYYKVDRTGENASNPVVTEERVYLTADMEDDFVVAQANEPLDENRHFVHENVSGRHRDITQEFKRTSVDLMDVSPKMVFSVATAMIPFLQNDDANRALMGSNMQRQAVPLMITEAPVVDTGMAAKAAVDSGVCVVAKKSGTVEISAADRIVIRNDEGGTDEYILEKFKRSNQCNCYNQKPIVFAGDRVVAGDVIADGASTQNGEIALGKNPLIGFMTWEGYNYEDAVLLSEKMVQDDVFTSIHIESYDVVARDTKLGPEEITRDVPGLGEDALKNLDENGIIRIGAEVRAGDILVGKVTPKGETDATPEERLLRAIFGDKSRDVRDTSLKLPHGAYGVVIDTKVFKRETEDDMQPGEREVVHVYIAQKRKISVGDKMAGRHGNKGVVSRVLPVEDMPFLPNGRPLDIVLNPLGVPSRMNIGQVLEIHLSLAARVLGFDVSTPIFDGAKENDIGDTLELANDYVNTEWEEFHEKYKDILHPEVMEYLGSHLEHRELWKGVKINRDGKVWLRDGRTGEYFDNPVTIGHMHYLKLHHLVDDKIHARSTGPYSLVTQQPLGGKAQFGGQRFGEMEVWALEAYGAAHTLQEILTIKSDDVVGRVKAYEAIVRGLNTPESSVPESFKVLLKEMQALGLDVSVMKDGEVVEIKESSEYGNTDFRSIMNDERVAPSRKELAASGFDSQRFNSNGELVSEYDSDQDRDMDDDLDIDEASADAWDASMAEEAMKQDATAYRDDDDDDDDFSDED